MSNIVLHPRSFDRPSFYDPEEIAFPVTATINTDDTDVSLRTELVVAERDLSTQDLGIVDVTGMLEFLRSRIFKLS